MLTPSDCQCGHAHGDEHDPDEKKEEEDDQVCARSTSTHQHAVFLIASPNGINSAGAVPSISIMASLATYCDGKMATLCVLIFDII